MIIAANPVHIVHLGHKNTPDYTIFLPIIHQFYIPHRYYMHMLANIQYSLKFISFCLLTMALSVCIAALAVYHATMTSSGSAVSHTQSSIGIVSPLPHGTLPALAQEISKTFHAKK